MGKNSEEFDKAIHHEVEKNVEKLSDITHFKVKNNKSLDKFKMNIDSKVKDILGS